jgi:hypothetical protein
MRSPRAQTAHSAKGVEIYPSDEKENNWTRLGGIAESGLEDTLKLGTTDWG